MAKHLYYYSESHLKNIEMFLSKLYITMYNYEAPCNKVCTHKNIDSVITNYVMCASNCFV